MNAKLSKMTMLTIILMVSAIALASFSYFKIIYAAKRKITIITQHAVKSATGGERKFTNVMNIYSQAPGPKFIWPILGNLTELGKYDAPSIAFTELAKLYGDIYSMTLGTTKCLVVNNLDLIREVLNQNGKYFGARPDFLRFHKLFGGDRSNCKFWKIIQLYNSFYFFFFLFSAFIKTNKNRKKIIEKNEIKSNFMCSEIIDKCSSNK